MIAGTQALRRQRWASWFERKSSSPHVTISPEPAITTAGLSAPIDAASPGVHRIGPLFARKIGIALAQHGGYTLFGVARG